MDRSGRSELPDRREGIRQDPFFRKRLEQLRRAERTADDGDGVESGTRSPTLPGAVADLFDRRQRS